MASHLIGQIIIHDMEKFMPYVASTSAAIAKYGGEVLDVVEAKEVLEGNWPVSARTALVRFPDAASLRRFWNSLENADEGIAPRNSDQPRSDVHFSSGR